MTASTTIPTTVQLRRSRLVGLMAVSAALAACITWALLVFAVNTGTEGSAPTSAAVVSSLSPEARQYVEGIMALTPAQLVAAYGTPRVDVLSSLGPQEREYVEGIMALTPAQLAAAYGNEPTGR